MSDKRTFIDSNILLYLYTENDKRKKVVMSMFKPENIISTQVVNENVNVCLKKLNLSKEDAFAHGKNLLDTFNIVELHSSTITMAFIVSIKYGFTYWDSLIVSAALENNCEVLLTEDMQDGQLVEGRLKIKNPFKNL